MLKIGHHAIDGQVLLAPMAGVTDLPFRRLSRAFGAGLTTSEMLTCDTALWDSRKSRSRLVLDKQNYPASMQIAGSDPLQMAKAAVACVELGADIIDINMGCPAKKVLKKLAGSALLGDETLVRKILHEVVNAVDVPVTLKTRTGTSPDHRNGINVARIAEDTGIQALAIHGRSRACKFKGEVEYDTIREIVNAISIPVFANGDIDSPEKAKYVLTHTGASAVMVGRGALGQPWLLREIQRKLSNDDSPLHAPTLDEKQHTVVKHLDDLHQFYGDLQGVRIARKHFGWYCDNLSHSTHSRDVKKTFNTLCTSVDQIDFVHHYFYTLKRYEENAA